MMVGCLDNNRKNTKKENNNMEFYDKIKEQVSELTETEKYQNDGTAFGHFIIKECFNKIIDFDYDGTDFDQYIKDHIVDMAHDLGNDAIFTNIKRHEIMIFQFKYSKSQLLNTTEIKKNKKFIDWILGINENNLTPNHKLKKIIDEELNLILTDENIQNNNYQISFYYIDNGFIGNIETDIQALYNNYRDKNIKFDLNFYNYKELEVLYDDVEIPKNKDEFFVKKLKYHDELETNVETVVTSIYANSLKPIIEDKKELVLALNVRYYKGVNEINSKIKKEYSKGEKSNFWLLNNGINAVCEHFEIIDEKKLKIKNFQIVNGGQTAMTLRAIINDLPDNVQILMRLTKIEDKTRVSEISMDIAVASNSQNAISARDLHSGDRIQNKIFEHLNKEGIFYDKKDGEWATVNKRQYKNPLGNSPMHLKIKNMDLGVAYLSFYLQKPISTAGRHKLVFSDEYYDIIFDMSKNEDNQFYKLILAYRISERINNIKSEKINNFEILQNNYINDVLLSLSALYFFKNDLFKFTNEEELKSNINCLNAIKYIEQNDRFVLSIPDDFDVFIVEIIKALQYLLSVMKQAKKMTGEEWLSNDTNKWLKKDGTYRGIFEEVIKKLKEEL